MTDQEKTRCLVDGIKESLREASDMAYQHGCSTDCDSFGHDEKCVEGNLCNVEGPLIQALMDTGYWEEYRAERKK